MALGETARLTVRSRPFLRGPFRSAAHRHRETGQVVETGTHHDPSQLPGVPSTWLDETWDVLPAWAKEWEDGFVTGEGEFLTREEAAQRVGAKNRWLESEDLKGGSMRQRRRGLGGLGVAEYDFTFYELTSGGIPARGTRKRKFKIPFAESFEYGHLGHSWHAIMSMEARILAQAGAPVLASPIIGDRLRLRDGHAPEHPDKVDFWTWPEVKVRLRKLEDEALANEPGGGVLSNAAYVAIADEIRRWGRANLNGFWPPRRPDPFYNVQGKPHAPRRRWPWDYADEMARRAARGQVDTDDDLGSLGGSGRRHSLTTRDIEQWIDNDEGLYTWWKDTGLAKRAFIARYRREIVAAIENVLEGRKPAHYLAYDKKGSKPPGGGHWQGLGAFDRFDTGMAALQRLSADALTAIREGRCGAARTLMRRAERIARGISHLSLPPRERKAFMAKVAELSHVVEVYRDRCRPRKLGGLAGDDPVVLDKPLQMYGFRMAQLRAAVKLEKIGMKHSSGRSVTAMAKRELGMKRSATHEQVIAVLEREIAAVKRALDAGETTTKNLMRYRTEGLQGVSRRVRR